MAKISKTKSKKPQAQTFRITKVALAGVEVKKAMIEPYGEHAIKVTSKQPRSSKYRSIIIHRQNLISASGGEMDFDGTVSYRGFQEIYSSTGTIDAITDSTIRFTDTDGIRHDVPASTDQNIVLTIVSDAMDRSEVAVKKTKKSKGEEEEAAPVKLKSKKTKLGKKLKTAKKASKFPTRKVKKA